MADIDPIVIPIQVSKDDSLDVLDQKLQDIGQSATDLRESLDSPIPMFGDGMIDRLRIIEASVERMRKASMTLKENENAPDYHRSLVSFRQDMSRMAATINDLRQSAAHSSSLNAQLGEELSATFTAGLRQHIPALMAIFRSTAESMVKASGTQSDQSLIEAFTHTAAYKNVQRTLAESDATTYSPENMMRMVKAILPVAVPQYLRASHLGWMNEHAQISRVRDMLPASFSHISFRDTSERAFNKTARQLDGNELAALRKIVRNNPYLAPEFERAGLMKREHGRAYFNNEASEENVNSLGGLIARMFTIGIKGRYSTRGDDPENNDIEYPFLADKFLKRTNMYVSQSRKIAEELSEAFPWMNPEYVEKATLPKSRKSWSTMGDFRARPRQTTSEFLEFGMNEFDENGRIIFDQTEDGKPIKKFLPVNNSLMQRKLAQQAGADPFEHNGFNRNEIFMRLPLDELSDYHTTEERREEIRQRLIHAISEDKYTEDGSRYVFSGLSNNHAVFTRADIKQAIESQDPNFFRNGETQSVFTSQDENSGGKSAFERFGRAMDAAKKARTDTEDIREVYGSDLSDIKVVVADWQKVTGMDGQNIISRKYAPETFQGRDYGGKSTYQAIDMAALFEMYPQFRQANGDMLIPGAAVGGGDLLIPHDVGLIEEWGNIKAKAGYSPTMTQEEINKRRTEEVRREGIGMKTTAGAAATDTRYISAQAAASMTIGKAAREYFDRVFNYELASLEDIDAVKKLLFSGDDYLSRQVQADEAYLNSAEARRRIEEYRDSLWARRGKGDILLPQGSSNYAMISAWLPDVFNHLVEEAGFELTDEQKRLSLRENVAYFASASDELAMFRNPATASGNIRATNKSAADASREYFEKVANMLGVDANALYVDPRAEILKKMQSADIDGDTLFVTALKHNKEFGEIMSAIMTDTAEAYKQLEKKADFKEGELDQIKEARTKPVGEAKDSYSMDDKEDVVNHLIASQGAIAKMGAADAVARNSRQNQMTKNVARAIMLGEEHYDVDSNGLAKKGREWLTTAEEWAMLREGAPFTQIVNWANKATKQLHPDAKPEFDQESFNQRNVDKVNFSSVNMGSALIPMYSRFYQAAMGKPVRDGHDWDMIFEKLPYVDTDTHAGKLTQRLRELKLGQMKGEFLAFDDSLVAELKGLAQNAMGEIIQSVVREHPEMTSSEQQREANRRYAEAGGFVVANLAKFGLTRDNIRANPELAREMADMEARTGRSVYAQGRDFTIEYADAFDLNAAQAREAAERKKRDETKAEVDRKAAITKEALERVEEYRDREISDEAQREAEELRSLIADKELQLNDPFSKDPDSTLSGSDKQRLRTEIAAHRKRLEEVDPKGVAEERLQAAQADEIFAKQENEKAVQSWREADLAARTVHDYIQRQAEFDRIIGGAEEFSRELKSSVRAKNAKLSDATAAELFYDKRQGLANYYISQLDDLSSQGNFDEAQRAQIAKLQEQIRRNVDEEFAQKAVLNADYLQEDIATRIAKLNGTYDPRTEELKTLGTQIENAKSYRDILLNMAKRVGAETNEGKDFIARADGITAKIGEIESQYTEYAGLIEDERIDKETQRKLDQELRNARAAKRTERLLTNSKKLKRDPFRIRSNNFFDQAAERRDDAVDRYDNQIESLREDIARKQASRQKLEVGSEDYKKATAEIEKLTAALHNAEDASKSLAGAGGIASAAFAQMGESVTRVVQQFGRQMFHQAANEVKRFVQQYNADMTTIQMITLKTDEEISNLGADLIDTAIDLKVSVSDVTTAASEIYRQGLTDEEVDVRLEDTMKFSKVAGIKAEEASKILTTAMTNGLVETSEEAMDALVALDDSVATSASEIAKGMQKSAASAKQAGMSYQELVTSLAIITSRTQLGGSSAGTALSTLMYRLFKVGEGETVYDEDGNYIANTKVTRALKNLGVEMFDGEKFRGPYQILVDIAKNWENASTMNQETLLSTLGAGRQRSNMATLIQGLAEDGGALAESYIDLASNSQGITDQKYLIYLESLEAAMTSVQSSFDELIASFNVGGASTNFLNFIAELIQGLTAANEATDGVITGVLGVAAAIIALSAAVKANPLFWGGMLAVGAVAGIASAFGNAQKRKQDNEVTMEEVIQASGGIDKREAETNALIDRLRELSQITNRTAAEEAELDAGMQSLMSTFGNLQGYVDETTGKITDYAGALRDAAKANQELSDKEKVLLLQRAAGNIAQSIADDAKIYASGTSPLFSEEKDIGRMAMHVRSYIGSDFDGLLKDFDGAEGLQDYIDDLGSTFDLQSFQNEDAETQKILHRLSLLRMMKRNGTNLTEFVPSSVFDLLYNSGEYAAGKIPGIDTVFESGEQIQTILKQGSFVGLGDAYAAYGKNEVAALRKHTMNLLADGIVNGSFDEIDKTATADIVLADFVRLAEGVLPELKVDGRRLALALTNQATSLVDSDGYTGTLDTALGSILMQFTNELMPEGGSVNFDVARDLAASANRWRVTDAQGQISSYNTRGEAEAYANTLVPAVVQTVQESPAIPDMYVLKDRDNVVSSHQTFDEADQAKLEYLRQQDAIKRIDYREVARANGYRYASELLSAVKSGYVVDEQMIDAQNASEVESQIRRFYQSKGQDLNARPNGMPIDDWLKLHGLDTSEFASDIQYLAPDGTSRLAENDQEILDAYLSAYVEEQIETLAQQMSIQYVKGREAIAGEYRFGDQLFEFEKDANEARIAARDQLIEQEEISPEQAAQIAEQAERLSWAQINMPSIGSAYDEEHRVAQNADEFIEALMSQGINDYDSFLAELEKDHTRDGVQKTFPMWQTLLNENSMLGALMQNNFEQNAEGQWQAKPEARFDNFLAEVAGMSLSYPGLAHRNTQQKALGARAALAKVFTGNKISEIDPEDMQALRDLVGEDLSQVIDQGRAGQYNQVLRWIVNNYAKGLTEFTDSQKIEGAGMLLESPFDPILRNLFGNVTDSVSAAIDYYLEHGVFDTALKEEAALDLAKMGIQQSLGYGDDAQKTMNYVEQIMESEESATAFEKQLREAEQQYISMQKLRARYNAGLAMPDDYQQLASMLGMSYDDVKDDSSKEYVARRLQQEEENAAKSLQTMVNACNAVAGSGQALSDTLNTAVSDVQNSLGSMVEIDWAKLIDEADKEYDEQNLGAEWAKNAAQKVVKATGFGSIQEDNEVLRMVASSPTLADFWNKARLADGTFDNERWSEFQKLIFDQVPYMQGATNLTLREKAVQAEKAWSTVSGSDDYDLSELTGATELRELIGDTLYRKVQLGQGFDENETAFIQTILEMSKYGLSGLSEIQSYAGASSIMSAMSGEAGISSYSPALLEKYKNYVPELDSLTGLTAALEDNGFSMSDAMNVDETNEEYAKIQKILADNGSSFEDYRDKVKQVNNELLINGVKATKAYGDSTDDVVNHMREFGTTAKSNYAKIKSMNTALTKYSTDQYYREKFRAGGKLDDATKANIHEQTGFSEDDLELYREQVLTMLDDAEAIAMEELQAGLDAMGELIVYGPDVKLQPGTMDTDAAMAFLAAQGDAVSQALHSYLQFMMSQGAEVAFDEYTDANGHIVGVKPRITKMPGGMGSFKPSGGGGGGGGGKSKTAAAKLLEDIDHTQTVDDHIIKMIQYEQTMYKNADELTNYGIMLQHEIDEEKRQVEVKKQNIAALKEEIAKTEQLSDDWYSLRDAIMKAEEELKDLQNTIDENLDALKENEQAILKLHTDLEQTVKAEIENRLQREEDMLAGSVSLQETILEAIRQRYRDEWELMQEDIEKKKEALQEEISLIDERLQRRKDAEDEAEKHEQLAEYKRQLAMISLDSTRTADQAELRKKIAELEKEIAWDVAEDEAEAQKQGLQDQIDAYDEYVEEHQKELDELLENANNFAEEVNGVMRLNQDELFAWLKENVQEYANSLGDAQKQMLNTWEDTFKQMKGITDTYWADIAKILSSKESFIEYMKGSQEYINASEDEKKQLIYGWELMYDTYINANKVSDEAVDYTHDDTDYTTSTDTSTSSGSTTKYRSYYTVYDAKTGAPYQGYGVGSTQEEADRVAAKLKQDKLNSGQYVATKPATGTSSSGSATSSSSTKPNISQSAVAGYSTGGIVDYTGLAMVHGSPARPEAFLDADDTSMIRSMLDSWKYIKTKPVISSIDSLFGGRGDTNVGEVNVVINQAELKEDADFEEVARRVGEAFTKELAKQGFNTAAYAL